MWIFWWYNLVPFITTPKNHTTKLVYYYTHYLYGFYFFIHIFRAANPVNGRETFGFWSSLPSTFGVEFLPVFGPSKYILHNNSALFSRKLKFKSSLSGFINSIIPILVLIDLIFDCNIFLKGWKQILQNTAHFNCIFNACAWYNEPVKSFRGLLTGAFWLIEDFIRINFILLPNFQAISHRSISKYISTFSQKK